jgi:transcriptional regulator with XRE-family HTH domain
MNEYVTNRVKAIAKTIDDCIKGKGMNRNEFASLMKVQPSNVTKWLSGQHNFTLTTLLEIEYALGLPLFINNVNEIEAIKQRQFNEWLNKAYVAIEELKKYSPHTLNNPH